MKLSASYEAANNECIQEFVNILRELKAHYCDHHSPPMISIRSQINAVYINLPYCS